MNNHLRRILHAIGRFLMGERKPRRFYGRDEVWDPVRGEWQRGPRPDGPRRRWRW
jgi:hypothetical protein